MKLHTMIDLRGALPVFAQITEGGHADIRRLDQVPVPTGRYLVMDRGYLAFSRLRRIAQAGAFVVSRRPSEL